MMSEKFELTERQQDIICRALDYAAQESKISVEEYYLGLLPRFQPYWIRHDAAFTSSPVPIEENPYQHLSREDLMAILLATRGNLESEKFFRHLNNGEVRLEVAEMTNGILESLRITITEGEGK